MDLFKRAFGMSGKHKEPTQGTTQVEGFKQMMTAIAAQVATGSPRESRAILRDTYGVSPKTAYKRFKDAMEIQKWLNENKLTFRYQNDD